MTESQSAFACMQWPYPSQDMFNHGPSLFTPPMKTWLELILEKTGLDADQVCLCHAVEDGVERWWWEQRVEKGAGAVPEPEEGD